MYQMLPVCTQILLASCGSRDLVPLVSLVVVCLGIEAEQCCERLQNATCNSTPQVSYASKPYKISDSASLNSTHMYYDDKRNCYELRVLYV